MSTSALGPEDIRAAAEVHRELGPEYSDAVVAAFLDKVDREVAARVQARLADNAGAQAARRTNRRSLAKGVAIGLCGAGGLMALVGIVHARDGGPAPQYRVPQHEFFKKGPPAPPKIRIYFPPN
jgi:hypothetical protein